MEKNAPNSLKHPDMDRCTTGVYLVGAGPGAFDLITVRGAQILAQADVVLYDALIDQRMLSWCTQAKLVEVGKRCGAHSCSQHFINKQLVDAGKKYPVVARLKGGDPLIFGRAMEEIIALEAANLHFEIIPGITTALAASAALKQPPTVRNVSRTLTLTTMPTHLSYEDQGTAIYYMGRDQLSEIAQSLIRLGRPPSTPVCLVESVSLSTQKMFGSSLGELLEINSQEAFPNRNPVIVMVGDVYQSKVKELLPLTDLFRNLHLDTDIQSAA
jgi:uroporphyrin-III C-methyltransferase